MCNLPTLNIHWKDWCWSWSSNTLPTWSEELTRWKRFWCWERRNAREGETEDEMVGWYHQLNWLQFEQAPGDSEGQGSLAGCSPWSHRIGPDWLTQQKWCLDRCSDWGLRNSMIDTWCRNQALNQNLLLRVLSPLPVNQICLSPFPLWEK